MIEVIDNFLDEKEIEKLYDVMWTSDWYLIGNEYGLPDKNDRRWSFSNMIFETNKNYSFYKKIGEKLLELPKLKEYVIYRTLINAYKFSDVLSLHVDPIQNGCENLTAIIYGNREWNINWGSETIFTTDETKDAEIIKSVIPKPGRLVIFESKIPHTGRCPSSIFPNYRYSLVYNLKLKKPKQTGLL